jgi:hypothetical protein
LLYFVPRAEKAQVLNQCFEVQISVKMLGLLQDANGKGALDERLVDKKVGVFF